jgi:hypothetical protein
MNIPHRVTKALNSASGVCACWVNDQYTQEWLSKRLGLVTDDNEHDLGEWKVDFCWKSQRWFVAA